MLLRLKTWGRGDLIHLLFSKLQTRNWNDLLTTPSLNSYVLILEMHPFCNTLVVISQTHETNKNASVTIE